MATVWKCTNEQYHADFSRVSSTMLKTAWKSPTEYRKRYLDVPRLEDTKSDAFALGSAVHCRVLEPDQFDKLFATRPPGIDGRTKDGKEALAKFRLSAIGKTELTQEQLIKATAMSKAVLADAVAAPLLEGSIKERAIIWEEDGQPCKCKPDIFIEHPDEDYDILLDLKTSEDPSPEAWCSGSGYNPIRKYRYDLQLYHYSRGVTALTGRPCAAGVIVVGTTEPFDVFVYSVTGWLAVGERHWNRAMDWIRHGMDMSWRRPEQTAITPSEPMQWD